MQSLSSTPVGPGSAHFFDAASGREFAVIGKIFFEISSMGALTNRGAVTGGTNATICSNGKAGGQIMVTSGGNLYIFTLATNAFQQITSMNGLATIGNQLDGFFLALNSATAKLQISALNDGTSWDPTQFAQRNIAADPWVSMAVANRYIWLFGAQTSEVWYDAGTAPFPFQPYPSGLLPYGCVAPFSPVVSNGVLVWVGATKDGQGQILQAPGFTPQVISTYALEVAINGYSVISDAIGDTYTDLGHTFYLINFPTANKTLCFDSNMNQWHERGTWISEQNQFVGWRPRFHAQAFGQHRMLDGATGTVYQMSTNFTTDVDMRSIRRVRTSPALFFENRRLFVNAFELDMEVGLGNTIDPGSNPQVMLRMSPDGGKTFGPELWRNAGQIGQFQTRVRWNRCGQARRRVFEVSVTDGIPWRILNAMVEMRQPPAGLSQAQSIQWQSS